MNQFLKLQVLRSIVLLIILFNFNLFAAPQPDNSKINEKIKDNKELNAQDQSESDLDIKLTQKIRQEMMKQKSFSTEAKNIKIITINGKVTIKGPVKTNNEKNIILGIASKEAKAENVVNQITVIE